MSSLAILLWLTVCAVCDWRTRRVPNLWTYGFLLVAVLAMLLTRHTLSQGAWMLGVQGAGMAALVTLPGFLLKRLGGGDVKLLLGLGLATSAQTIVITFLAGTLALVAGALWCRYREKDWENGAAREWPFVPCLLVGYLVAALRQWPIS